MSLPAPVLTGKPSKKKGEIQHGLTSEKGRKTGSTLASLPAVGTPRS